MTLPTFNAIYMHDNVCYTIVHIIMHADTHVKTEPQPKMAWGEVKEEAPQCSDPQPNDTMKMPPLIHCQEEPKAAGTYIALSVTLSSYRTESLDYSLLQVQ